MLKNLKVLELASVLAGPSVGQFFAELGADVIKVENLRTGGDVTRSWKTAGENTDNRSAYFCSVNWGKKSVAVDLNTTEGKSVVQKLATKSDIVIASYKPGDAAKLGVAYEQLTSNNRQLIYGQITGYGSDNDRVGYDAVIQAESGFVDLNGEKNGEPIKMPIALIDVLAGHHLKEGLLLALLHRERTGEGSLVEVSLIQAAVSSLVNQASNWLVGKKLPVRQGSAHPNIAPYGESFITKDNKRVLLAVGNDRQFFDLIKVLGIGHEGLGIGHEVLGIGHEVLGSKFSTNQLRVENRTALNVLLQDRIGKMESKFFLDKANEKKIPAGIIQNVKEVFEIKEANELLIQAEGLIGVRGFAASSASWNRHDLMPPPHFGEHTEEVLKMLHSSG